MLTTNQHISFILSFILKKWSQYEKLGVRMSLNQWSFNQLCQILSIKLTILLNSDILILKAGKRNTLVSKPVYLDFPFSFQLEIVCGFTCETVWSCLEGAELDGVELVDWAKGNAVNQRPPFSSLSPCFGVFLTVILWFDFDVPICAWWIIVWFADNLWESSVFWWHSMQMGDIWVLEITTVAPLHLPPRSVSKLTN